MINGWKPAIVWGPDGDSCNQLDCLLLACKQLWFCMVVGIAVASQLTQLLCKLGC